MYIESGIFQDYGINNFSLRRQVSMRKRKKLKKRKELVNYEGRRYKDYLEFVEKNPTIPSTQMDTVYNQQDGPYIQTFIFQNTDLMNCPPNVSISIFARNWLEYSTFICANFEINKKFTINHIWLFVYIFWFQNSIAINFSCYCWLGFI